MQRLPQIGVSNINGTSPLISPPTSRKDHNTKPQTPSKINRKVSALGTVGTYTHIVLVQRDASGRSPFHQRTHHGVSCHVLHYAQVQRHAWKYYDSVKLVLIETPTIRSGAKYCMLMPLSLAGVHKGCHEGRFAQRRDEGLTPQWNQYILCRLALYISSFAFDFEHCLHESQMNQSDPSRPTSKSMRDILPAPERARRTDNGPAPPGPCSTTLFFSSPAYNATWARPIKAYPEDWRASECPESSPLYGLPRNQLQGRPQVSTRESSGNSAPPPCQAGKREFWGRQSTSRGRAQLPSAPAPGSASSTVFSCPACCRLVLDIENERVGGTSSGTGNITARGTREILSHGGWGCFDKTGRMPTTEEARRYFAERS